CGRRRIRLVDAAGCGQPLGDDRVVLAARAFAGRHDPVQGAEEVDDIELTVQPLRERRDLKLRVEQLVGGMAASTVFDDAPDAAADEIAEHVPTRERGNGCAAVDVAAGNRASERVRVIEQGIFRVRDAGADRGRAAVRLEPLAAVPAVVAAALDDVDFLARVLADVAGPERAALPVERESPRVAQSPRVDLGTAPAGGV